MKVPVVNAGVRQWGTSAITLHAQFLPPPPPAPLPSVPSIVETAPLGLPVAPFLHKKAKSVLVDGDPGIQQGHDIGYGIPHAPAVFNAFILVHMALSKHKVMFPVESVLLEGKPVGTYICGRLGGLICGNPVSMPTGLLINTNGTVETSATLADVLKGLAYIAIDIIVDYLWNKIKGKLPKFKSPLSGGVNAFLGPLKGTALGDVLLSGIRWQVFGAEALDRVFQHLLKNWGVSPLLNDGLRGNPGLGRGKAGWKPFDKNLW